MDEDVVDNALPRRLCIAVAVCLAATILTIFAGAPHFDRALSGQFPDLPLAGKAETFGSFDRTRLGIEVSKGKFLVASRQIKDPRFMETVILLTQYGSQGTVGLIVNRPTEIRLSQAFPDIKGLQREASYLYSGGPVGINQVQLLIRSQDTVEEARRIFGDVYVSSSRNVLDRLLKDPHGTVRFRIYSGYAGWLPEQLEREIDRGDWHVIQADAATVFEKAPSEIWPEFIRRASVLQVRK